MFYSEDSQKDKMNQSLPQSVLSLRIFGSIARGDDDLSSDLDIIAIVGEKAELPEDKVNKIINELFNRPFEISWYGITRIKKMFKEGHLFAWHLFLESKEIKGNGKIDILSKLGTPSKYQKAEEDICNLLDILESVNDSLKSCNRNLVYEAGIIYVCARNIAVSASAKLSSRPDYSRLAPYNPILKSYPFPIRCDEYKKLILARHASIRGTKAPNLILNNLIEYQSLIYNWGQNVLNSVREVKNEQRKKQ